MYLVPITGKKMDVASIKFLVVAGDNIDDIRFSLPKLYDGKDLSVATWYVRYLSNISGDLTMLTKSVSGDTLYLDWTPKEHATATAGNLDLQLQARLPDGKYWHTLNASIRVERSVEVESAGGYTYAILEQYLTVFETLHGEAEGFKNDAQTARDTARLWAESDIEVVEGSFSAKHWAGVAQAIVETKATKVVPVAVGNLAALTELGDLADSGGRFAIEDGELVYTYGEAL